MGRVQYAKYGRVILPLRRVTLADGAHLHQSLDCAPYSRATPHLKKARSLASYSAALGRGPVFTPFMSSRSKGSSASLLKKLTADRKHDLPVRLGHIKYYVTQLLLRPKVIDYSVLSNRNATNPNRLGSHHEVQCAS